ncbi:hypothetical protein FOZ62_021612, partial [Perkinsus olseni]
EFSRRPGKKVYATELSDGFIQHLKSDPRIDKNKVEIIGCTEEDLCLPAEIDGSVDLAVLCDVYHHLTYPKTMIQQLRESLKGENIHVTNRRVYDFQRVRGLHGGGSWNFLVGRKSESGESPRL